MHISIQVLSFLCAATLSLTATGCRNVGTCSQASCKGPAHSLASPDAPAPDKTADLIEKVSLDASGNLLAVTASGTIIFSAPAAPKWDQPQLSPDKKMYGALVVKELPKKQEEPSLEVSDTLVLFEMDKKVREILPGDFIRSWTFWERGSQVVIYSGALHFAGHFHLYDIKTGKELRSVPEADLDCEKADGWVQALCR